MTQAISAAFFEELASTGYARLSLEAVAKRAGAGKAAIYRRSPSKLDMTVALVTAVAVDTAETADTGTLRGDVHAFRGELPADVDRELALDFLAGPLYWRLSVVHTPTGPDYLNHLTHKVLTAITA
ncbi:TetR-like C-terminal domain-containing protein [Kitasatospora sp. NPDC018058]|uniref:TetR-like C-terminal domain-containing protein n=1 Tax=Kitasatospora sp. NPDC018058 TaxID=3364025 RepID=UPI0037BF7C5A